MQSPACSPREFCKDLKISKNSGLTLIELLVVIAVIAVLSAGVLITAQPNARSEADQLATQLTSTLQTLRTHAMISDQVYGLYVDERDRSLQMMRYMAMDNSVEAVFDAAQEDDNTPDSEEDNLGDKAAALEDILYGAIGLGEGPIKYHWQTVDALPSLQFPQDFDFAMMQHAASQLTREMARVGQPSTNRLTELMDTQEENATLPDPHVLFFPSGIIMPESAFMLQVNDTTIIIRWNAEGNISQEHMDS